MTLDEYLAIVSDTKRYMALATQPPLTEIKIGDKVFPVGQLSPEQISAETERGIRLQNRMDSNFDPFCLMRQYLEAGSANFSWDDLPERVDPTLTLTFSLELNRQLLVAAMVNHSCN